MPHERGVLYLPIISTILLAIGSGRLGLDLLNLGHKGIPKFIPTDVLMIFLNSNIQIHQAGFYHPILPLINKIHVTIKYATTEIESSYQFALILSP
jgi:hypothetical protein